jgi:hypothetical protein
MLEIDVYYGIIGDDKTCCSGYGFICRYLWAENEKQKSG